VARASGFVISVGCIALASSPVMGEGSTNRSAPKAAMLRELAELLIKETNVHNVLSFEFLIYPQFFKAYGRAPSQVSR
jgi:hypothetical protein